MRGGPLAGIRVLEMAGLGPGPHGAMILADYGADVVTVERRGGSDPLFSGSTFFSRGKRSITADLKTDEGRDSVLDLIERADVFIDPFRPGVCERLGIGPDVATARNPRLVYARITGWGQTGPLAHAAGHDLTYISIAGALYGLGRRGQKPTPPMNLLGDFAGGGMLLALGVCAALTERASSGLGQVIDAAMVDGAALVSAPFYGSSWGPRGTNMVDTGAHFYEVYECADGGYVAVAAIEPQFYAEFMRRMALDPADWPQWDKDRWPELQDELAAIFLAQPQQHWVDLLEGSEACVAAVVPAPEAPAHPHNVARESFIVRNGLAQPAPAPRFSRTPATAGETTTAGANDPDLAAGALWP